MTVKGDSGDRASCIPPAATWSWAFVLFPLTCFGARKLDFFAARKGIFLYGGIGKVA